jgi:hypothetical protein
MHILDFNTSELKNLKEEELIQIYNEIIEFKNSNKLKENSLLLDLTNRLKMESFGRGVSAKEDELIRVELYVSMKLAEKYISTIS